MRIRAIKPGFFLNERLADLSPWHRLCFAGLWTVADREGRLEDRPRRIKAEIFPYDDLEIEPLLADLARAGFIVRYEVADQRVIWIPSWATHQFPRPDEKPSSLPPYKPGTATTPADAATYSVVTDPQLRSDGSDTPKQMGSGIWGTGDGVRDLGSGKRVTGSGVRAARVSPAATCPRPQPKEFVDLWNEVTQPPIPRCYELTDKRRRKIQRALTKRPIAEWRAVFAKIQASPFCRGETSRSSWRADFDWIIREDTIAVRVLEGKYDDDRAGPLLASQRTRDNRAAMGIAAERIKRAGAG